MRIIYRVLFTACIILLSANSYSQSITSEPLSTISFQEVGALSHNNGGLELDVFAGSNMAFISFLIQTLPETYHSETISDLTIRLLASKHSNPNGKKDDKTSEYKLIKLARLGKTELSLKALSVISQSVMPPHIQELYISMLLYGEKKEQKKACNMIKSLIDKQAIFWRKQLIFCQLSQEQANAAEFGLTLLKKDNISLNNDEQELLDLLRKHSNTSKEALSIWRDIIASTIFSIPETQSDFPKLPHIFNSVLSSLAVKNWWKDASSINDKEKMGLANRYYSFLSALNEPISPEIWQGLIQYYIANKHKVPTSLFSTLIDGASISGNEGESLLLLAHAQASAPTNQLDPLLLRSMIGALKQLGYSDKAKQLSYEGLGIE